jgi:hypothetical protein
VFGSSRNTAASRSATLSPVHSVPQTMTAGTHARGAQLGAWKGGALPRTGAREEKCIRRVGRPRRAWGFLLLSVYRRAPNRRQAPTLVNGHDAVLGPSALWRGPRPSLNPGGSGRCRHSSPAPADWREPMISTAARQQRAKNCRRCERVHITDAGESATSVRCWGGTDVRSCRSLCLFAAPFDPVQGRVPVLRVGLGALGSDRSDDRAGVPVGAGSHRMIYFTPLIG